MWLKEMHTSAKVTRGGFLDFRCELGRKKEYLETWSSMSWGVPVRVFPEELSVWV